MKRITSHLTRFLAAFAVLVSARAADVLVAPTDFQLATVTNRRVTLTPVGAMGAGGNIIVVEPRSLTVSNSSVVFSNTTAGTYRLDISGAPPTALRILVPDVSGVTNAVGLLIAGTNSVDGAASYAYSAAASDARYARAGEAASAITNSATLHVDVAGDDSTAERGNPAKPWRTIVAALSNAVSGDLVQLGVGTHVLTNQLRWRDGVTVAGQGIEQTTLYYPGQTSLVPGVLQWDAITILSNNVTLRDFSFQCYSNGADYNIWFPFYVPTNAPATNVVWRNLDLTGISDMLNTCARLDLYANNVTMRTLSDLMVGFSTNRITFEDSRILADGLNGEYANGYGIYAGEMFLRRCYIQITNVSDWGNPSIAINYNFGTGVVDHCTVDMPALPGYTTEISADPGSCLVIGGNFTPTNCSGNITWPIVNASRVAAESFVGNANGLTNFSRSQLLSTLSAVTNNQGIVSFGTIIAGLGGFAGNGQAVSNITRLDNGTHSISYQNPSTWLTPDAFTAASVTAGTGNFGDITSTGTVSAVSFAGDGSGLTSLNWSALASGTGGITNILTAARYFQTAQANSPWVFRYDDNGTPDVSLENRDITATTNHGVDIMFRFANNSTTTAIDAARIRSAKEGTWTTDTGTQDSYLSFSTTTAGTSGLQEKLRLSSAGNLGIGSTNPVGRFDVVAGGSFTNKAVRVLDSAFNERVAITDDGRMSLKSSTLSLGSNIVFFGDSITAGTGNDKWESLVAMERNLTANNFAVGGYILNQMVPSVFAQVVTNASEFAALCCVNDLKTTTNEAQFATFTGTLRACIAWLGIPEARKVVGRAAAGVTYTGSWTDTTELLYGKGKRTTTLNDTASFTNYGSTIYVGSAKTTNTVGGAFSVAVDGASVGTFTCYGAALLGSGAGETNTTSTPFVVRIPNLSNGPHSVVVTATDVTGPVYFEWSGGSAAANTVTGPRFYLGNTLRLPAAGYATYGGSDSNVVRFNGIIQTAANDFASDGLGVLAVDASSYYFPEAGDVSGDNIHPGETGHRHIADAFLQSMNAVVSPRDRSGARLALQGAAGLAGTQGPATLTNNSTVTVDGTVWRLIGPGHYFIKVAGTLGSTNTASEVVAWSGTAPGGALGTNGVCRVSWQWEASYCTNTTYKLYYSGSRVAEWNATSSHKVAWCTREVSQSGAATQRSYPSSTSVAGTSSSAAITGAVGTATNFPISLRIQNTGTDQTNWLNYATIEMIAR